MSLKEIRERVNIVLYDSKATVLRTLRILNLLISIFSLGLLGYYYGFPQSGYSESVVFTIIQGTFAYYVLQYLFNLLYDFHPLSFLRRTWYEGLLMLLLIIEGISYNFFGLLFFPNFFVKLGLENFGDFSTLFILLYFIIAMLVELGRGENILPNIRIHPSTLFINSFLVLIVFGTGLLMLPEMTVQGGSMGLLNAFFTATSATCVTGLTVVDTASFFSFKGHVVILVLMKLGGLNIVAFGSFLAISGKLGIGVKQHQVLEDFVHKGSLLSAKGLLGRIIIWGLAIELIGTLLIFFLWSSDVAGLPLRDTLFFSLFHAVSAFNNAGLSVFTNGMYNEFVRDEYLVHIVVIGLMILGSLGFMYLLDLFSLSNLRDRLRYPWKKPEFSTRLSLSVNNWLLLLGAIIFFILEFDNVMAGQGIGEKLITSIFHSATARSVGLNTVDIGSLTSPMVVVILFLMFIGGGSSSSAGGIKTSTFGVIWASAWATIKGKRNVEVFQRTISQDLALKAFSILLFFIVGNVIGVFLLSLTESDLLAQKGVHMVDIIFEQVSALGTVGLSTGITPDLSFWGRIIVILSMFIGRVGTLTVVFALSRPVPSTNYKLPRGHTMVG